jgi:phage terminase large subunit
MALPEDTAIRIGLDKFYTFKNNRVEGANGTVFIFKGLGKNIRSIKSTESVDIVWIEEAETTSKYSIRILFPTIRKAGSQIICTFNTGMESDPIYQRLVIDPQKNPKEAGKHYCRLVTYLENPDISEEFLEEAEAMRESDPEGYDHIYLGETWSRADAQVLSGKWRIGVMDTEGADGAYFGLDFGFSVDPSVLTKTYIIGKTLYIEREACEVGVEIEDYPEFLDRVDGSRTHKIRADNARPELISHIKKKTFNIVACKKWDGCVEDGISLLRSFTEIVIHPRCKQTAREAKLWRYKTDRLSGDVLPVLIDANNHAFDSVRYALEPMVKPAKDISIRVA